MLIQFSVKNYLSFQNLAILSMVASAIREHSNDNLAKKGKLRLLKSAAIYGANASGKSNLLKAMNFARHLVVDSARITQAGDRIGVKSFKLDSQSEKEPSFFEFIFICKETRYRYGFEVTSKKVCKEWLFYVPKNQEARLFERTDNEIKLGSNFKKEGKDLIGKTRKNALFLSVVAQFNGEISKRVMKWFERFNVISGLDDRNYMPVIFDKLKKPEYKSRILEILKIADLGIKDIVVVQKKFSIDELPLNIRNQIDYKPGKGDILGFQVKTMHEKINEETDSVSQIAFDLEDEESEGTKKVLSFAGPFLDTLSTGKTLVIDEFDSRLHPLITRFFIKLFNSKEHNPFNAQLIFSTHDVNVLDRRLLRRDQIWFTEKNRIGATDLFSLVEYKVRNDASFKKDYLLGKYGAIPSIKGLGFFSRVNYDDKGNRL